MIQLVPQFLTHRLTQGIGLTTGKVGKQTGEQHHLLLIDRNTISVFQILLHNRNIVLDRLASLFTVNEIGYVVHRSRTIKGVHRNQVLERTRFQFAQILLHTRRFELERTDGAPVAIELVSIQVVNGYIVDVEINILTSSDVLQRLFDDGKGFQTEKVHLYQSRVLNHRTFVLGHKHLLAGFLIVRRTDRYPVGNVITADNGTTGMYTGIAHIAFQHLCIFDGITQNRVGRNLCISKFYHFVDSIGQVHFLTARQLIGNCLTQAVRLR